MRISLKTINLLSDLGDPQAEFALGFSLGEDSFKFNERWGIFFADFPHSNSPCLGYPNSEDMLHYYMKF